MAEVSVWDYEERDLDRGKGSEGSSEEGSLAERSPDEVEVVERGNERGLVERNTDEEDPGDGISGDDDPVDANPVDESPVDDSPGNDSPDDESPDEEGSDNDSHDGENPHGDENSDEETTDAQSTDSSDADGSDSDSSVEIQHGIYRIPRRVENPPYKHFSHDYPRVPLSELPDNEYDRTCAICFLKYEPSNEGEVSEASPAGPERAVRLPCCGNTVGERCLLYEDITRCPFCRRELIDVSTFQEPNEDVRRWLCWAIRRGGIPRAAAMHRHLLELIISPYERQLAEAVNLGDDEETDCARQKVLRWRRHYDELLDIQARRRYISDGASLDDLKQWQWNEAKAINLTICVQGRYCRQAVSILGAEVTTDEDLREYIDDEEYGPYGSVEDYRIWRKEHKFEGDDQEFTGMRPSFLSGEEDHVP